MKGFQLVVALHWKAYTPLWLACILAFALMVYFNLSPYFLVILAYVHIFREMFERQRKRSIFQLIASLPITRSHYIVSFYLFHLLHTLVIGLGLWLGYQGLQLLVPTEHLYPMHHGDLVIFVCLFILLLLSNFIPSYIYFNSHTPSGYTFGIVLSLFVVIFAVADMYAALQSNSLTVFFENGAYFSILLLSTCVVYLISMIVSSYIFNRKTEL